MSDHETVIFALKISLGVSAIVLALCIPLSLWITRLRDQHTAAYPHSDRVARSAEYLQGWHFIDMLQHLRAICFWIAAFPLIVAALSLPASLPGGWQPAEMAKGVALLTLFGTFLLCRSHAQAAWEKWLKHKNP